MTRRNLTYFLYKLQDNNCFRTLGQSLRAPDAEMTQIVIDN